MLGVPSRNAARKWGKVPKKSKSFTREEIAKHNSREDCWVIIDGQVYDVTNYLINHPGGSQLIFRSAGGDCTQDFQAMFHSKRATAELEKILLGVVAGASNFRLPQLPLELVLISTHDISHDTKYFVFKPTRPFAQIPLGHHILILNDRRIKRPYTPVRQTKKTLEFVIKRYEGGAISPYLHSLESGSRVRFTKSVGTFQLDILKFNNFWFFAAGTGITPIYQLLCHLKENDAQVKVDLMYNNKTEDDILMKEELSAFEFLTVTHCFSESDDTHQPNGRITEEIVQKYMHADENLFVGVCGPKGYNDSLRGILEHLKVKCVSHFFE